MFRFKNRLLRAIRREDMANSPFHMAIKGYGERRSQLFPDRRRIPGRKAKVFLGLGFIFQMLGMNHIIDIKRFMKRRDQDMSKIQRKAAPFLQAMSDVRYCALETRKNMIIKELFSYRGQEFVNQMTSRFNQKDVWCPYLPRYPYMYNKTFRNIQPYNKQYWQRFSNSYDHYNI